MSNSPRIAVVDDDEAVRESLSDLLQVLDLPCRSFDRAEAFLTAYASGAFTCLITDLRMPGIGGVELLRRMKALGGPMPVIVITSSTDHSTHRDVMENGAMACLTKPIRGEELIHHLRALGYDCDKGRGGGR
ncbi:response regulator [Roseomonas hellenica]|uniref:Response regulator n=1 Tax=Plastoroseomonas hellenica TaxID=2687306 RepID=A0ABS5F1T0_9PROT|nr:response regulator [Plastoroseomonas hellenica]MBR0666481.1 response regulator [Plastoroseomonas hellenica]